MEEATVLCSALAVDHMIYYQPRLKATAAPCMRYNSFGNSCRNVVLGTVHVNRILKNEWAPLYPYAVEQHPS